METKLRQEFTLGRAKFWFDLCRQRSVELGSIEIDQWWMPVTPLYGQRSEKASPGRNHQEILRAYWHTVRREDAESERRAQERYLLASLVPDVRSQGSRTIFADAFLAKPTAKAASQRASELEALLKAGGGPPLDRHDFHIQSHKLLARQEFPPKRPRLTSPSSNGSSTRPVHNSRRGKPVRRRKPCAANGTS